MISPSAYAPDMGRLLVGFDGSPPSRRAVEHATQEARTRGHDIVLLTVIPREIRESSLASMMPAGVTLPPELSHTFEENARDRLKELMDKLASSGIKVAGHVRAGLVVDEFVRAAEEVGASEIVIGNKAFEPGHVELGPNAAAIAERAKVRVTLVP